MSEFTTLGHSDFIAEFQRLHAAQRAAIQAKDTEAIDLAAHDMAMFLRLNAMGRLAEWFARQHGGDQ